jgi:hypothetical protein
MPCVIYLRYLNEMFCPSLRNIESGLFDSGQNWDLSMFIYLFHCSTVFKVTIVLQEKSK